MGGPTPQPGRRRGAKWDSVLEMLCGCEDVVEWKRCRPVSDVEELVHEAAFLPPSQALVATAIKF